MIWNFLKSLNPKSKTLNDIIISCHVFQSETPVSVNDETAWSSPAQNAASNSRSQVAPIPRGFLRSAFPGVLNGAETPLDATYGKNGSV